MNPDTNSDSPSAKSNGVRLVSAKQDANQIKDKGAVKKKNQQSRWYRENNPKLKPPTSIINDSRINANLTSYEMVWATARSLPSREYLELEAQPAPIVVYTPRLVQHKKNNVPMEKLNSPIS